LVEELKPVPTNSSSAFFHRAAAKIHICWKKGKLPDKTSWASLIKMSHLNQNLRSTILSSTGDKIVV
jgi:hypothetical protein